MHATLNVPAYVLTDGGGKPVAVFFDADEARDWVDWDVVVHHDGDSDTIEWVGEGSVPASDSAFTVTYRDTRDDVLFHYTVWKL